MHIPDGYISPQTAGGLWAAMVPAWYYAGRKVRGALAGRRAPLIAASAAFAFVVMMFNVPVPGGTTGHVVGGTLLAVVVGPWAAVLAVTAALVIQALFFGDGGIIALGANCFNIAFVSPVAGYFVYRLVSGRSPISSYRHPLGAGIGAYVGLNAAALLTALELGIQPLLFHDAAGTALYSPYDLSQTVPAMMSVHLLVIGVLEAVVTSLAVAWMQRTNPGLLFAAAPGETAGERFRLRPLLVALALMLVFVPLGLLASAPAWGEWSSEEIAADLGFVPAGMERLEGLWSGVLPDYGFPGGGEGVSQAVGGYLVSAALGLAAAALVAVVLAQVVRRRSSHDG